ncbi:hypothetical protein SAMN06265827_10722 [Orenia metallireducens]|uniref:DUF4129 domain-containing protein n=1 Tax=Orenia metallireducens TaxID=1413210 RepID=A0A285GF30_9FIRM|nr:hypothetical protein [Orenia metallireducens]SNY22182.1 hypothetical protein SAMN06265827_10722 [Orenia metallireducens]
MRMRRNFILLAVLLAGLVLVNSYVYAESRAIHIGDLIQLEIAKTDLSKAEIRDSFKAFEIESLEKIDSGYKISIRSFEAGKKIVKLGDRQLKIQVASTLDEIDRQDIFEGDLEAKEVDKMLPMYKLLVVMVAVIALLSFLRLRKIFSNRSRKELSVYSQFRTKVEEIKLEDDNYFVYLTLAFKDYLEQTFNRKIIGKTSNEIIAEINYIPQLDDYLNQIKEWLSFVDICKYRGKEVSLEKKKEKREELIRIVDLIEASKEGVNYV